MAGVQELQRRGEDRAALRGRGRALSVLCTAQFVVVLDVTIVAVALPAIQRELGLSPATLRGSSRRTRWCSVAS
jgi:hypothetical protein